jgi:tetratricopeptide (TPR) repeat protein
MRKTLLPAVLVAVSCLIAAASPVSAQPISVTFVEGRVQLRSPTGWTEVAIGDVLPENGVVRLEKNSSVEFGDTANRLVLTHAGSYALHDLVSASRRLESNGVGAALSGTLKNLVSGRVSQQSAVMGVRGANESKSEQMDWVTSDAQVFVDSGKEYLKAGAYDEAVKQFEQAKDSASSTELPYILYCLASAHSLKGDTRLASSMIEGLTISGGEEWAPDFVLLKAKLDLESNAFQEEIAWLSGWKDSLSRDSRRAQVYYFLLALGYQGIGDESNVRVNLSTAVSLEAESAVGQAAKRLLESL